MSCCREGVPRIRSWQAGILRTEVTDMYLAVGIVDATWAAIQLGLVALVSFLPALIGALLIVVIGWFIAGILGRLVAALLSKIGFDAGAERAGLAGYIRRAGAT